MKIVKVVYSVIMVTVLLACSVNSVFGKRAFAIRMRSKSHTGNGGLSRYSRKNYQSAHMADNVSGGMVRNPPVSDVQQAKPANWNVDVAGPMGPPPAYHHAVPAGGAPPAYARVHPPSYAEAMGYSSHNNHYGSSDVVGRHYDYNTNHNNMHSAYSDNNIGSYGSNYGYHRGSNPFSVGSILTGVALWQLGHGLAHTSHHNHHHDHYQNYFDHNQDNVEEPVGSTQTAEIENPHIQVNADFDFGPSSAVDVKPIQKPPSTSSTPSTLSV